LAILPAQHKVHIFGESRLGPDNLIKPSIQFCSFILDREHIHGNWKRVLHVELVLALLLLIAAYSFVVSGCERTHIEANGWTDGKGEVNTVFSIVDEVIWSIKVGGEVRERGSR
jgi:hypothetical protein